jgi:CheY-like chemotaxis protein
MVKILIVDDEEINRIMLREMLSEAGYSDFIEAGNGLEAVELACRHKPDIVLLDVIMPGMSGTEAAPHIKASSPDCYLPILFITSLDDEQSLVRCLASGGDDFISKPFEKIILHAKLKAHERTRQLSLEIQDKNRSLTYFQLEVERNHRIVEHIFDNAIGQNSIAVDYFDFYTQPEAQFNGDLFLCEQSPSGGVYVFIGDFTGHGLASAIGAIPVAQLFTAMTLKGLAVGEMASRINRLLVNLLPADMFCVASILEINANGKNFTVWSGGLPRLAVKTPEQQIRLLIDPQHMPLGILEEHEFDNQTQYFETEWGDTLLLYTDGLMESHHKELGMLGEEGVEKWFTMNQQVSAQLLVDKAELYRAGEAADDDITIALFQCRPFQFKPPELLAKPVPFNLSFHLTAEHIKDVYVIDQVVAIVNSIPGLAAIRSELFTVITELTNNAIEHGILGLSSDLKAEPEGFIEYYERRREGIENLQQGDIWITVQRLMPDNVLEICMQDSGPGFDVSVLQSSEDQTFGRGFVLIRELCESLQISDSGKQIKITMSLMPTVDDTDIPE